MQSRDVNSKSWNLLSYCSNNNFDENQLITKTSIGELNNKSSFGLGTFTKYVRVFIGFLSTLFLYIIALTSHSRRTSPYRHSSDVLCECPLCVK